jgi:sec-independent protein translocase protein TatA
MGQSARIFRGEIKAMKDDDPKSAESTAAESTAADAPTAASIVPPADPAPGTSGTGIPKP